MNGYTPVGPDFTQEYGGAVVTSGVAGVVILGPYDLLRFINKSLWLYNMGAATLSGAVIQINPDQRGFDIRQPPGVSAAEKPGITREEACPPPNPGLWITYDQTSFRSLAPGETRAVFVNQDVARWWRVVGVSSLPQTTVSGWVYATSV